MGRDYTHTLSNGDTVQCVYIGTCWERCTMLDGKIRMCRMELWQVNGERQFGRILEVL